MKLNGKKAVPVSRNSQVAVSRRAILQIAAAGTGILILQPAAAFAATPTNSLEKRSDVLSAYIAMTSDSGVTDLNGIRAEYRAAAAIFPLDLPPGWVFPAESSLYNTEPDVQWQRGGGAAEAYLYWQSAVATAAYHAYLGGDSSGVEHYLDTLESGYNSAVRRAVLEDVANEFITVKIVTARNADAGALAAARRGDFTKLKQVSIH